MHVGGIPSAALVGADGHLVSHCQHWARGVHGRDDVGVPKLGFGGENLLLEVGNVSLLGTDEFLALRRRRLRMLDPLGMQLVDGLEIPQLLADGVCDDRQELHAADVAPEHPLQGGVTAGVAQLLKRLAQLVLKFLAVGQIYIYIYLRLKIYMLENQ